MAEAIRGGEASESGKPTQEQPASGFAWYFLGLAALGLLVGVMSGLSDSPVVGVLLPLLFGLIGGGAGLYGAKADLKRPQTLRRIRFIGAALAIFSICTIVAAGYGISLRKGLPLAAFLPGSDAGHAEDESSGWLPADASALSTEGVLELAALRFRLVALGVEPSKADELVKIASLRVAGPISKEETVLSFKRIIASAQQARSQFLQDTLDQLSQGDQFQFDQLFTIVQKIDRSYQDYVAKIGSGTTVPLFVIQRRIQADSDDLSGALHDRDFDNPNGGAWLFDYDPLRSELYDLELIMAEEASKFAEPTWMSGGRSAEAVNELLKVGLPTAATQESSPPSLRPSIAN